MPGRADEAQFVAPLLFNDEVVGFWAFGASESEAEQDTFRQLTSQFTDQIAELVYRHQRARNRRSDAGSRGRIHDNLRGAVILAERRLSHLEQVFREQGTAAVCYDLFGRISQINHAMERFLKRHELPGYELNALDLMCRLSGLERARARHVLRYLILEREPVSLPVTLTSDRHYTLQARSVVQSQPGARSEDDPEETAPFRIAGILFELVDTTEIEELRRLQGLLVERIVYQLRNDTESQLLAADLLVRADLPSTRRERVVSLLKDKVNSTLAILDEARDHLRTDLSLASFEHYPVDGRAPLQAALRSLQPVAEARQIRFEPRLPELLSLVLAAPQDLEEVLTAILEALLQDAAPNSVVRIDLEERDRWLTYHFGNTGYGMPEQHLHSFLHGPDSASNHEFFRLREAIRRVERWRGELQVASEVGSGLRITLRLRSFV